MFERKGGENGKEERGQGIRDPYICFVNIDLLIVLFFVKLKQIYVIPILFG